MFSAKTETHSLPQWVEVVKTFCHNGLDNRFIIIDDETIIHYDK